MTDSADPNDSPEARLRALGITLPPPPTPAANYVGGCGRS